MLTRAPLCLFEADEAQRLLGTRARASGDPDSLARHAAGRLRTEHPHQVGLDLHNTSPEAHAHLVDGMRPNNPHRAVIAAAPHLHALNQAHKALKSSESREWRDDPRRGHSPFLMTVKGKGWDENKKRVDEAASRYKQVAETHGKTPGELFRPHSDEKPIQHLKRMFSSLHGLQNVSKRSPSGRRSFNFKDSDGASAALLATQAHYSKTHKIAGHHRDVVVVPKRDKS